MHKFKTIYLDLDGVIADFKKRYMELFKDSPDHVDSRKKFSERFAKFIHSKEFATLDLMPDALTLLTFLKTTGVPVEILSSTAKPTNHADISNQKKLWLDKHGITYPAIFVPGKKLKANFADPNSILIDDTKSNIEEWNKLGGFGILHIDALTTIDNLVTILRR